MRDERVPSFFVLVPGPWGATAEIADALAAVGVAAQLEEGRSLGNGGVRVQLIEDANLARGFGWGRRGRLDEALLASVAQCSHAALLEVGGLLHEHAPFVARAGRALRDAGGVAVRMEASGAAAPWDTWLEQLASGDVASIYESAVVLVRDDDDVMFTCGMHHFDLPESQVSMKDAAAAMEWLDAFCVFQLTEGKALASGHTFRPNAESQRRVLERWPDHRHHPSDGRHNPFGIWRFLKPGVSGVKAGATVSTIIPSLVAVLSAAEEARGRPLKRAEVKKIVADSSAIAMDPRDAVTLERSRGYADIEPELAWEQWQIVRETL